MENMHVILTPFTSVPATSKIDLINEKREGYGAINRLGASNMTLCFEIKKNGVFL